MLLPWYQETGNALVGKSLQTIDDSKSAFGVYSFVEAAIFVVVVGVLVLLWARAERKAFHLPGGDGTVIMGAGLWVMFLIFYRQLDKPNGRKEGLIQTSIGVDWGIFIAFLLGALLAYAGYRIRAVARARAGGRRRAAPGGRDGPGAGRGRSAAGADGPDTEATVVARRRRPPTDELLRRPALLRRARRVPPAAARRCASSRRARRAAPSTPRRGSASAASASSARASQATSRAARLLRSCRPSPRR